MRQSRLALFRVALLGFGAITALECAQWTRIQSSNFELYTTTSEEEGRKTLETYEQTREFFLRTQSLLVPAAMPVVVIAFGSAEEFKPYSYRDFAPAYYVGDEQRDYVVMSELGSERTRVAVHEYVHVLVRQSGLRLPLWLNEGLADVFSAMKPRPEGKVLLGYLPDDRASSLGSGKWMRLAAVVNVRENSPEYKDASSTGMFYAQSCLLTQMLMLGEEYRDKFPMFVDRIATAESSEQALGGVFGKSLGEIEKDMLTYFRQNHIGGETYAAADTKVEIGPARQPTESEVELTLAKIVGLLGRVDEARKRLGSIAAMQPASVEIAEAEAYLAWRSGEPALALQKLQPVVTRGAATSWKTYWDFARLTHLTKGDRSQSIDALRKAVEAKPDLALARLMLAGDLYAIGHRNEALSELRQIKNIAPRDASSMYLLMAQTSFEMNERVEARQYVEQARRLAQRPEDVSRAESLLQTLESRPAETPVLGADDDNEKRPILRRRPVPSAKPGRSKNGARRIPER